MPSVFDTLRNIFAVVNCIFSLVFLHQQSKTVVKTNQNFKTIFLLFLCIHKGIVWGGAVFLYTVKVSVYKNLPELLSSVGSAAKFMQSQTNSPFHSTSNHASQPAYQIGLQYKYLRFLSLGNLRCSLPLAGWP